MGTGGSIAGLQAYEISGVEPAVWNSDLLDIGVDVPGIDISQTSGDMDIARTTGNLPVTRVPDAIPTSQEGVANGVATLGADGKVPNSELNVSGGIQYIGSWNASTNTPTLANGTGTSGDLYKVSDAGSQDLGSGSITFQVGDEVIYDGTQWDRIPSSAAVASVNSKTGAVVINKTDVGLGNVDNTSDANKPVSTAQQAALDEKVAKSGDTMSGGLSFGSTAVTNPQDLSKHLSLYGTDYGLSITSDTLNYTAGGKHDFYSGSTLVGRVEKSIVDGKALTTKEYVDNAVSNRVSRSGDTMSGALDMGSNKITSLDTPTNDADAVTKAYVDSVANSGGSLLSNYQYHVHQEEIWLTDTSPTLQLVNVMNYTTPIWITLPQKANATDGRKYIIKWVDQPGHSLLIRAISGDNIDGAQSITLTDQGSSRTIVLAHGNWRVIGAYGK